MKNSSKRSHNLAELAVGILWKSGKRIQIISYRYLWLESMEIGNNFSRFYAPDIYIILVNMI